MSLETATSDNAPATTGPTTGGSAVKVAAAVAVVLLAGLAAFLGLRALSGDDDNALGSQIDGQGDATSAGTETTELTTEAVPAGPGVPSVFRYYGNPQIAISLADTEAGGQAITAVSHRIRFPRSGTLTAVRPFVVFRPGQEGGDNFYHKGDGSTIEFRLETDDDTPAHIPTGEVLARTGNLIGGPELYAGSGPADAIIGGDEDDDSHFRKFSFIEPVQVEADTWYHLVMYNTGNDARNNFVSYDNFNSGDRDRDPVVPVFDDLDFAVVYESNGEWTNRDEHWAIGDYYFDDGTSYGNGYMEVGSVNGPDRASNFVSPTQSVRQRFVPGEDLIVTGAHVGGMHVDGPNAVTLALTDADGTVVWEGDATDFPTGVPSGEAVGTPTLRVAEFRGDDTAPDIILKAGQTYFLEVESTGGTHVITGLRDGALSYGFSQGSTVNGFAELSSDGGDWMGWQLGAEDGIRDQFDLSFYLVTANCVGCG